MKYKITKQYANDTEKLLAAFNNIKDANFFLERKIIFDNEKNIKLIYRLFNDQQLLKEFNKEKINSVIRTAEYADDGMYLPELSGPFTVSKDNTASHAYATFIELNDAELFVEDNLTHADTTTTYYLFKNGTIISEVNKYIKKLSESQSDTAKGTGQSASFNPTPFNTTPQPSGMPRAWLKDEKDDKEEKK